MDPTHQRTFSCACGKKSATVTLSGVGCYSIGEAVKATGGWKWVPLTDGGSAWLCIECTEKAVKLAKELVAVIGTDDFSIRSFAKKDE